MDGGRETSTATKSAFRRLDSFPSGGAVASLTPPRPMAAGPRLRVLLQVAGIHCPSCVDHINHLLQGLKDVKANDKQRLGGVSVSYLDHTVQFYLPLEADPVVDIAKDATVKDTLRDVVSTLKNDGYQPNAIECKLIQDRVSLSTAQTRTFIPFDVEEDRQQQGPLEKSAAEGGPARQPQEYPLWFQLRHPRRFARLREAERERDRRWQKHLEVCKSCREGLEHDNQREASTSAHDDRSEETTKQADGKWQADLALQGLTCTACVANVQKAAETVKGLNSIQVNLMSSSARITVDSKEKIAAVVEAVEDAGYGAELVFQERIKERESAQWRATYTVGGMTCASCVSNVEKAVTSLPNTPESFSVALMQGNATAMIQAGSKEAAEEQAETVREAIDDAGYDCSLEQLRQHESESTSSHRSLRMRVDGMFCSHCLEKVRHYLRSSAAIDVDEKELASLSLSNPIIGISYTPTPTANARSFFADIDNLDPAFQTHIIVPPSISSRSAQHARKELRSLLLRLVLAFLFVPPTLLIAVIVPTFLSQSHPLRHSLSRHIVGQADVNAFVLLALSTPVQFGVGSIFYKRAFKSLRSVWRSGRSWSDRLISWGDMNVLVALGTSVAYFGSLAFLIVDATRGTTDEMMMSSMTYFDACVFLVFFILFGRVLEAWSKRKTSSAVSALGSLRPSSGLLLLNAAITTSSAVKSVHVELLEVGDLVLIPSGSSPPLDSTFVATTTNSTASFLESAITGESRSVTKNDGDVLYSGTVNQSKTAITARVTTLAGSNLIDNVIEIVQSSSTRKADIEQLADRVTSHFVPAIVAISIVVLVVWLAVLYSPGAISDNWKQDHVQNYQQSGAQFLYALQFAVSVLVVACPCGIGLAAPTAQVIAIGLASKHGILVQGGGQAFQSAVQLAKKKTEKAFIFDKTGTITHGNDGSSVQETYLERLPEGMDAEKLWRAVWLVEGNSAHPIASGIRKWTETNAATNEESSSQMVVDKIEEIPGRGLKASFDKYTLLIGGLPLMKEHSSSPREVVLTTEMQRNVDQWQGKGASVVYVALQAQEAGVDDGAACRIVAALSMADTIRDEAGSVIAILKDKYKGQAWMVSGDTRHTAEAIASQVGIPRENVVAGVLPAEKAEWVQKIKQSHSDRLEEGAHPSASASSAHRRLTMFVGDGINDAPALSSADLSIALGSGSTLATSTASFILLNTDKPLASIPTILSLSRATQSKIWQNLGWACAFNLIFIPIAAGVFVDRGFTFGPSWSGLAMALSSVSVVLNALTLRLWHPPRL